MKKIKKWLATLIFKGLGWRTEGEIHKNLKKYVIIAAPHTSNWDFIFGRLYFYMYEIPLKFLIKKELFFFPLGPILKWLGGIPVDRSKKTDLTSQLVKEFEKHDELALLITPEGTRKYNPNWKKGFYYIAKAAGVPIILGYIDYEKKIGGIGPVYYPKDDPDREIEQIRKFYFDKKGKHPEQGVY